MKILMFIASSVNGGAEKVFTDLANALVALKHEVIVCAFEGSKLIEQLNPSVVIKTLSKNESAYNPRLYWQLYQQIHNSNIDIVHSHGAKSTKILYRLYQLKKFNFISTKHNSRKGKIFNKVPHVTGVSQKVINSIHNKNGAKLIYNGIPVEPISAKKPSSITPFKILAIGRLDPIKGFDDLIKAVQTSKKSIELNIIGAGKEQEKLTSLINSKPSEQNILLLGHQNNIAERISTAHAVIISSYSEGFSLVMIESLFYANLLLSTNVGSAEEILDKKYIIEERNIKNSIEKAINSYDSFQNDFQKMAQNIKQPFDIKNIAQQYINYYQQVIGGEKC